MQEQLLKLLLESGCLQFGKFQTKSGRESPYFFNFGAINRGEDIANLGAIYARYIHDSVKGKCDNLFGPSYKGIPLSVMTCAKMAELYKQNLTYTFNRKENKSRGEGGVLVGHLYQGGEKVLIVEDVLTGGTSVRESLMLLKDFDVKVVGVIVAVDREEKGSGEARASEEISKQLKIPVFPILQFSDVVKALHNTKFSGKIWINDKTFSQIQKYRDNFS